MTGAKFKKENGLQSVLSAEDAQNDSLLPWILDGLFNSGSYVVNLQKMREAELDISFYYDLTEKLRSLNLQLLVGDGVYWGDQGLLSVAFIGNIKYYGFQETQKSWYGPYNFTVAYYNQHDQKPDYEPVIYHFAGGAIKPWEIKYPIFPKRFRTANGMLRDYSELKPIQIECYFLWLEYVFLTDQALTILGR